MNNKIENYIKKEKFEIGREILLSIIISALISSGITFYFNKKMDDRVASREFIYNYSRTFIDNPKYRDVSRALEKDYLYGEQALNAEEKEISEYDLDDYYALIF